MGRFRTTIGVEHPARRGTIIRVPNVIVDIGAEATWIPRAVLESLSVAAERTEMYQLADGRLLEREVGYVIVHVAGKATSDDVVFAENGDLLLVGARSLEGLNLRVEPRTKQLVPGGPIVAALATC